MSLHYCDRGFRKSYTAHENISKGDICQICDNGKVHVSGNTDPTTSKGNLILALENITADNEGMFLIWGIYDSTGLTSGALQYLGTSGAFTETKPTGDCTIRIIGYNISTTELFFNPNKTYVDMTGSEASSVLGINTPSGGGGSFSMDILELTQQTMQQHDSTADLAIEWKQQDTTNSNFSHSTTTNPEQITCETAGWLDIRYSIVYDEDDGARLNTEAYITLNGTRVDKSTSRKTYYRGANYGKWGNESQAFYLEVSADDVIELHSGVADGNTNFTLTRAIDTVPDLTNIQIRYLG